MALYTRSPPRRIIQLAVPRGVCAEPSRPWLKASLVHGGCEGWVYAFQSVSLSVRPWPCEMLPLRRHVVSGRTSEIIGQRNAKERKKKRTAACGRCIASASNNGDEVDGGDEQKRKDQQPKEEGEEKNKKRRRKQKQLTGPSRTSYRPCRRGPPCRDRASSRTRGCAARPRASAPRSGPPGRPARTGCGCGAAACRGPAGP